MDVSEDSSSAAGTYDHDVFLSFSGFGGRFAAEELCHRLKDTGIHVFKGEELGLGGDISCSLRREIKRSRISIPIIAYDYGRNARFLDEVVQMLECRESQGQRIFPVYLKVDPHHIRNQMSAFRDRFTEHERGGIDTDRIEKWKKALRQVLSLKGWEVSSCPVDDDDLKPIVSYVLRSLKEDSSSSVTMGVSGVSSLVQRICVYDVFLNFGPDVERDFSDLLYHRLKDAGVLVFRGEHIMVGEEMVDFTQQVIKRSRISIPVFSRHYARSGWCLDEVTAMVEGRKSQGHRVFPIYLTDPYKIKNDLRDSGYSNETVEIWDRALREVTSLKGWELNEQFQDGDIERIISHVLQSLMEDSSSTTVDVSKGLSNLVDRISDYDVFLNFRPDTRGVFADLLYHRLKDAGVLVFRGEDIAVGEEMVDSTQVIKRSRISIPVFSGDYARSRWFLDEVTGMVECRKSQGHRVFPIYYEIDPDEMRDHLRNSRYRYEEVDPDRVGIWKQALREVASLKGWKFDQW